MSRTIELEVTIEPGQADKRQAFISGIEWAILTGGLRMRAGTYKVTIERVQAPAAGEPAQEPTT